MTKDLFSVRLALMLFSTAVSASVLVGCKADGNLHTMGGGRTPHKGYYAPATTYPPDGKDGAALCDPNISGPHQWPLNVSTEQNFYPDPNGTPVVKQTTPSGSAKNAREVTITVQGSAVAYPGQTPE